MSRALAIALMTGAMMTALPTRARAADTGTLGGPVIQWLRFFIHENGSDDFSEPSDPTARRKYLNLAHCQCAQQGAGAETEVEYEVKLSTTSTVHRPGEVWVGTNCDDAVLRATQCSQITDQGIPDISALATSAQRIDLNIFDVINPVDQDAGAVCSTAVGSRYAWILVDTDSDGTYDYTSNQNIGETVDKTVTGVDTEPPPVVVDPVASASEGQIKLSWTLPTTRPTDIYAYQALCSLDGAAVKPDSFTPQYQTTTSLCEQPQDFTFTEATVAEGDGVDPVTETPAEFKQLDKSFLCGEELSATSTSLTISGLQNDKPYKVALLVVDFYGNVTPMYFNATVSPREVTDFWEDLHDRGSHVQGGCLGTSLPGDGGPMGGLLIAGAIGVAVMWRKRRKVVLAGAILAASTTAMADGLDPYWNTDQAAQDDGLLDDSGLVKWHVGVRVGPYTPDIDKQAGKNATTGLGPFEAMFGNYATPDSSGGTVVHEHHVWQVLPMLDVDRVLWRGFGQVTVGGSIGYMQKTALAYARGTSADDLNRLRQPGNETVFRLIPLEVTAGYRFTWLHEEYSIPVVPFVRGGLGYYMWLMRAPNGDLSRVCEDGSSGCTGDKDADKAKGASLGVVGSIGLSIRAEDIDNDSARSMRETGIQHAGFYAELSLAKVDGFGSDTKLNVGHATWFAGLDFEF